MSDNQWVNRTIKFGRDDMTLTIITNNINGVSLQSWWVFTVLETEVKGILTDDIRNETYGPYSSLDSAIDDVAEALSEKEIDRLYAAVDNK